MNRTQNSLFLLEIRGLVAPKPMCMADNSRHPTIFLDLGRLLLLLTTDLSFYALYVALETLLSLL